MAAVMDITLADDLWASHILPEGYVERWLVADGAHVQRHEPLLQIRIEDALHDILAPGAGYLAIYAFANHVVWPGFVLGRITEAAHKPA